jgi:hypothetical protein
MLMDKEISLIWGEKEIIDYAIKHWNERVDKFIYPAKSYCVAICYAKWIERDYGDNFWDLLNDPALLYSNDPYFEIYKDKKHIYNPIISAFPEDETLGMIPDIRDWYEKEIRYDTGISINSKYKEK